jgi:hypothetical protein
MRLAPVPAEPEERGQFWKDFIRDTAPVFRESMFEQLGSFIAPTWRALLDGARYVDERLPAMRESPMGPYRAPAMDSLAIKLGRSRAVVNLGAFALAAVQQSRLLL